MTSPYVPDGPPIDRFGFFDAFRPRRLLTFYSIGEALIWQQEQRDRAIHARARIVAEKGDHRHDHT